MYSVKFSEKFSWYKSPVVMHKHQTSQTSQWSKYTWVKQATWCECTAILNKISNFGPSSNWIFSAVLQNWMFLLMYFIDLLIVIIVWKFQGNWIKTGILVNFLLFWQLLCNEACRLIIYAAFEKKFEVLQPIKLKQPLWHHEPWHMEDINKQLESQSGLNIVDTPLEV